MSHPTLLGQDRLKGLRTGVQAEPCKVFRLLGFDKKGEPVKGKMIGLQTYRPPRRKHEHRH